MEQIFLSRRNLLVLLSKLDRKKAGEETACTIIKCDDKHPIYPQTMRVCLVTALEDAEYYTDRAPGPVLEKDLSCLAQVAEVSSETKVGLL